MLKELGLNNPKEITQWSTVADSDSDGDDADDNDDDDNNDEDMSSNEEEPIKVTKEVATKDNGKVKLVSITMNEIIIIIILSTLCLLVN
jgi:hypothetical protein